MDCNPTSSLNPLITELNPICHLLALLGAHHILHVSRIRVNIFVRIFEQNGDVLSQNYKYLVEVLCSKLKVLGIAVLWYKTPRSLVEIYQRFWRKQLSSTSTLKTNTQVCLKSRLIYIRLHGFTRRQTVFYTAAAVITSVLTHTSKSQLFTPRYGLPLRWETQFNIHTNTRPNHGTDFRNFVPFSWKHAIK